MKIHKTRKHYNLTIDMFPKRHEAGCDVFVYLHRKLSCT